METVSFDAAYGNERITAYLYLPKNSPPPYQTIIYFPGVGAVYTERELGTLSRTIWFIDYFMKSGRAVMLPVYKGTSFRNDGLTGEMSNVNRSHQFTDWLIAWTTDFSRSIDYLETRADIDTLNPASSYVTSQYIAGLSVYLQKNDCFLIPSAMDPVLYDLYNHPNPLSDSPRAISGSSSMAFS
jgi:hypothetical protein